MKLGVICLCFLAFANVARADDSKETKRKAKELMIQGAKEFDLGNFPDAIEHFKKAYQTYPYPDALYDLGQAYRMNHDYDKALYSYRLYLDKVPATQDRKEVEARIKELEELSAKQKANAEKPPDGVRPKVTAAPVGPIIPVAPGPAEPSERRPWYADRTAWVVTSVGVAAIGVGLGFLAWSSSLDSDATSAGSADAALDLRNSADTKHTIGMVTLVAGAAACATGIGLLVWNPSHAERKAAPVAVRLGVAGMSIEGRF